MKTKISAVALGIWRTFVPRTAQEQVRAGLFIQIPFAIFNLWYVYTNEQKTYVIVFTTIPLVVWLINVITSYIEIWKGKIIK